jgi:catechol 2,3-dioxygenase-like lactoylglutathione lyase family enzyme
MIQTLSHTAVYVDDQEAARAFYVDKLGFEVRSQLRELVARGVIGCGVLETDDWQGTHEALQKRGVEFKSPPTQRPYGLEAVLKDNSGNWFSLVQRPR